MATCIFCKAEAKLTKEHIWPDWLKNYIPKDMPDYLSAKTIESYEVPPEQSVKRIGGDPHSRRVKCVCAGCNNGWMSELQQAAKPIVVPIIEGMTVTLNKKEQKILAAWSAMSVMCSEQGDPPNIAIAQDLRDILFNHHVPPTRRWRTWAALHDRGELKTNWARTHFLLAQNEEETERFKKEPFYNSQSSTYMVGPLLLHTISSDVEDAVRKYRVLQELHPKVFEISPSQAAVVTLDPASALTDAEAVKVGHDWMERHKTMFENFMRKQGKGSW